MSVRENVGMVRSEYECVLLNLPVDRGRARGQYPNGNREERAHVLASRKAPAAGTSAPRTMRTHAFRPPPTLTELEGRTLLDRQRPRGRATLDLPGAGHGLYQDVLNRAPDPAGEAAWVNALQR